MPPEVRYARSGDLRIAYQVLGTGPIDIVYTSGASSHLDLIWESPHWARLWNGLAEFSRLIVFDKRGTGLSDRPDHLSTLEERIDDIRTVMDAASSTRATLIGVSEGGPMALLFAATYPDRVRSLVVNAAKAMADRIPDARLIVFPGEGHLLMGIAPEWTAAVQEFTTGKVGPTEHDRFLATLVSMDIVGSTDLIGRIGDAAWRDLLDRHYALVARQLATYGGVEVDRAGDGFLARFDGPGRAIRFAQAVEREDHGIGLTVRAGVHTGEVELAGSSIRGVAVHTVSRIASLAKA